MSIVGILLAFSQDSRAGVVIDDPLIGGTTGTVSGGTFIADGWRVDGQLNYIYWHVSPTIPHGAYEFDIRGLGEGCNTAEAQKAELANMYDWTFNNSDTKYWGGYRENPYKHALRKQCRPDRPTKKLEILWKINENHKEDDAGNNLTWNPNHTYHWRVEWEPDGQGNTNVRTFRDGVQVHSQNIIGIWNPIGHSIKLGSSLRDVNNEGAYIGSVFSNFKVYDLSTPTIAEVTPDPDTAYVGFEYIQQLTVESGGPVTNWSVLIGRPGMAVDGTGRVFGWIPTAGEIGPLHTIQIQAQSSGGSGTEQWQVKVKYLADFDNDQDVDLEDFGKLQACYSGDGVFYGDGCDECDLDSDRDVDQSDFIQFQGCLGGANQIPNCP